MPAVTLATALPGAGGSLATAAATVLAAEARGAGRGAVLVEVDGTSRRPTLLASTAARELEDRIAGIGLSTAARGRLAWVNVEGDDWLERVGDAIDAAIGAAAIVIHLPAAKLRGALDCERIGARAVVLRADLPRQRSIAALAVRELRSGGAIVRVVGRGPGRVGGRRATAGIDPGGELQRVAERTADRLRVMGRAPRGGLRPPARDRPPLGTAVADDAAQALPLALGAVFVIAFVALALAAIGGGVTAKARAQRVADLAALSGARSMRDDFDRLFAPARLPGGRVNPQHIGKATYLHRAADAAVAAAERNGADPRRIRVEFPDADSFAPLRVRVEVTAKFESGAGSGDAGRAKTGPEEATVVTAVAAAAPPAEDASGDPAPSHAAGGGYAGPLVYRHGEGMRPDVAAAFDRMAAAAARDGVVLAVNSGFRSDAEQAILFAQNPDPQMVAPPGQSLHRCATELDLGPPGAYAWLAAHASRFGFVQRYSWEAWHYGFVAGPAPCSPAGERTGRPRRLGSDGAAAATSLPDYVPAQFREPLLRAAARWNVSPALLAAQLMAESNFNPFAISPAGAQGIAQFMPTTAAAYGLDNPFDAAAAIDAQAHLMRDLLEQFGSIPLALAAYNAGPSPVAACTCVPPYPETQSYVARILGVLGGAGALPAPAPELDVRLVG